MPQVGPEAIRAPNRKERNGPPLSVTTVIGTTSPVSGLVRYSSGVGPARRRCASARASSTTLIASCWFAVGDQCQPNAAAEDAFRDVVTALQSTG